MLLTLIDPVRPLAVLELREKKRGPRRWPQSDDYFEWRMNLPSRQELKRVLSAISSPPPANSDELAGLQAPRVRVLALDWLHDQTFFDCARRCFDASRRAIDHRRDILQIGHESALLTRRGLDTDAAEVLRFTAILANPT